MNGDILKELRLEHGLSQKQVGDEVGVASSTIRMIESNQRNASLDVANKLATFFNVSIDYLEGRTKIKNSELIVAKLIGKLFDNKSITDINELDVDLIAKLIGELNK